MHDRKHAVYVISVAAELAGVHPQTLRIYERKGLLEPARTGGGSRRHNLVGVQRVLELEAELAATQRRVEQLEAEVQQARNQTVQAVEEAHRSHRRDLVPLRQEIVLYSDRRPRSR